MRSRLTSRSHGVRSKDELSASLHFDGPRPSPRPCSKAMRGRRRNAAQREAQRSAAQPSRAGAERGGGVGEDRRVGWARISGWAVRAWAAFVLGIWCVNCSISADGAQTKGPLSPKSVSAHGQKN